MACRSAFLLDEKELDEIVYLYNIEPENEQPLFGFLFNISGRDNISRGLVIASTISIQWVHPTYED